MRIEQIKPAIPWGMAGFRAALGPVLIAGAACSWSGFTLASIVVTALVSDIYDGVLARRWRCDTPAVRLCDSMADTVFYLCTAAALWVIQPRLWQVYGTPLAILLALEAARFALDFAKFGKPSSYHSYLSKLWGLVLALAVISVFATHRLNVALMAALFLGILCDLQGLAMSLLLPVWRKDVKTLSDAWALRKQHNATFRRNRNPKLPSMIKLTAPTLALVLVPLMAFTIPAHAVEAGEVAYTGGTIAGVPQGTIGTLDTTSPNALVYRVNSPAAGTKEVAIPYADIVSFHYYTEVARHLGVAPAVVVGFLKRRERKHFFSITYTSATGADAAVKQVAIFEVAKGAPPALLAVLRARSTHACLNQPSNCGEFER